MILYSHRGNLNGPQPELENKPDYIDKALNAGFSVEVDVWAQDKKYFLGHDGPEFEIEFDWLQKRRDKIVVHAKNFKAFSNFTYQHLNRDSELAVFFHEQERYTLVYNCRNSHGIIIDGVIWAHDLKELNSKSIIPLLSKEDVEEKLPKRSIWGVCSDYVEILKNENR
tara:strand:+ start:98 stop:601 length:504 start_codon:yes stop_codon:yes gene_type:complete